ncbi:hypothetical protein BDZ85DRAFT_131897 [Elsinoe ampelina]|uniref:Uncharacterized protein n=1 Tax=Elsinoe ampelina TaxID=302913 RepID=A0A6A6FXG1_9PEZI|nr:hypothetical protein BDZ85DRAFT_131897 [Elsinoe ampelina]
MIPLKVVMVYLSKLHAVLLKLHAVLGVAIVSSYGACWAHTRLRLPGPFASQSVRFTGHADGRAIDRQSVRLALHMPSAPLIFAPRCPCVPELYRSDAEHESLAGGSRFLSAPLVRLCI